MVYISYNMLLSHLYLCDINHIEPLNAYMNHHVMFILKITKYQRHDLNYSKLLQLKLYLFNQIKHSLNCVIYWTSFSVKPLLYTTL